MTLDLGQRRDVRGLTYLPRPDLIDNGIVTGYRVLVSDDGVEFTSVGAGSWPDDDRLKAAAWPVTTARYVRLEVTAGVDGAASAAEVNVATAT